MKPRLAATIVAQVSKPAGIANVHTSLLSFCFSAARLREYRSAEAETPPISSFVRILRIRAAEKQKEGVEGLLALINRPPLRGLSNGCSAELLSGKDQRPRAQHRSKV